MIISHTQDACRVVDISILPAYRNMGIGTSLLTDLQRLMASSHLPIRLSVLSSNPARRLYERLQFRYIKLEEPYVFMEWRPEPNETGQSRTQV